MQPGTIMGERYKIDERIGVGGMASVYRAQDMHLGREIAIKIIHESLSGDEVFLQQFRNEAHAAANLSHPNIVMVHDIGEWEGRYFMVMEYVEGKTLKDIILEYKANEEFMPVERMLVFAIQICRGMGYAHRSGLVHCDMKPQNILIAVDDQTKITDFGISRAVSEATQTGSDLVWGTPQYFSPEQAAGDPPSPASDVYSIGIIIFEMLGSELPFKGDSPTAIALKHLQSPPPHIRSLNKMVPPQMAQILHKILAKEPSGRYRTAGQLERILETYLKQSQESTSPFLESLKRKTVLESDPDATILPTRRPAAPRANTNTNRLTKSAAEASRSIKSEAANNSSQPVRSKPKKQLKKQPITHQPKTVLPDNRITILGVTAVFLLLGLIPLWYFVAVAWGGI
ncbi:MAG: serine/threonine protein kinase [Cellvibrionaceae bacterium]|jgi:serine/threonine protein kinase